MKIKNLAAIPELRLATKNTTAEHDFGSVYICDMLSVVLAKSAPGDIWVTIQTHKNIIGVASIKNIPAIIIAENFRPDDETIMKAEEENIAIFLSAEPVFKIAKILAELESQKD